jgi:glutaminase
MTTAPLGTTDGAVGRGAQAGGPPPEFVSTGSLPAAHRIQALIEDAHHRYTGVLEGELSQVYPALAAASPARFGIAVAGIDGRVHTVGDSAVEFTVMSVAKPFVLALA